MRVAKRNRSGVAAAGAEFGPHRAGTVANALGLGSDCAGVALGPAEFATGRAAGADTGGRWLRSLRDPWPRAVCQLLEYGKSPVIRVLIAEVRGSAPREAGTCMLITDSETYGTIGGGNLEWQAIRAAKTLLVAASTAHPVQLQRLVLGRELGQCCGGVVQVWLERFRHEDLPFLRRVAAVPASPGATRMLLTEVSKQGVVRRLMQRDLNMVGHRPRFSAVSDEQSILVEPLEKQRPALWLYGAGHVAQALIHILAELPFEVTWVDSRAELLPAVLPDNVHPLCSGTPVDTVKAAPAGSRFLVMTHDHGLDYTLCRQVLERNDFKWLGLIGSKSKGARFRSRLARDGVTPEVIARLTCPIGIDGVNSKLPAAIAVAVAAQLLRGLEMPASEHRRPAVSDMALAVRSGAPPSATAGAVAAAELTGPAPEGLARDDDPAAHDTCTSTDCAGCSSAHRTTAKVDES
jgi:xanthine dehydrogenase accessory factor